jgi:hypothetical protein
MGQFPVVPAVQIQGQRSVDDSNIPCPECVHFSLLDALLQIRLPNSIASWGLLGRIIW